MTWIFHFLQEHHLQYLGSLQWIWTINHLNNYIWHPLAKSSRLKPSCPSFQYQANVISKLMVTPYHHYKKSRLFLLGKLIEKVTFCTFDNLTKELLWISWFEHACFDQSSRWTCVKLTIGFLYQHFKLHFDWSIHPIVNLINNQNDCQYVWFLFDTSLFHKIIIVRCQTRCACLMTHVNILR